MCPEYPIPHKLFRLRNTANSDEPFLAFHSSESFSCSFLRNDPFHILYSTFSNVTFRILYSSFWNVTFSTITSLSLSTRSGGPYTPMPDVTAQVAFPSVSMPQ